jgi:hypothetical protein
MSKVSKQNSQHNTEVKPPRNNCETEWHEYLDMKTNQMVPANDQTIERFGLSFYIWTRDNPKALKVHQFCSLYGISHRTLLYWRDKSEKFAQYYREGLLNLSDRRETGALERIYEPSIVRLMMHHYDDDWKHAEEWRSKLANKVEDSGTKIVVIEKYGEKE